jgi:N-acetylmuramoyl-L-alanine amidase
MKLLLSLCILSTASMFAHPFTIMLNPAGDAKQTGRKIDDSFERGITLQCAEQLKTALEARSSNVRVVLTRFPGETLEPLQNANFANRLDVDVYISLHFYQETAIKPGVYLYTFAYGNEPTGAVSDMALYSFDKAHLLNKTMSTWWAQQMCKHLENSVSFECKSIAALPFKPLIGIKAPAFALEIGLKNKHDWKEYVDVLAEGIGIVAEQIRPE